MTAVETGTERPRGQAGRWSLSAVLGGLLGLAPHLLHHVGLLAGAALLTGLAGNIVFAVVGLAAMTPMLLRLRRRFRSWWATTAALGLFVAVFAMSTLVIGPALRPSTNGPRHEPGPTAPTHGDHTRHHGQ